ncbi:chain-length determining protein [Brevundimonas diminuta]|uniref:chain-length determining protein n=1 Tax=Brevundimonas diminuta TaxID=293 RepID=UPI0019059D1E|nr:chain-length determining protein [Brevundimonas diminuta]MBK1970585.1 chain-length determining protein [Brevundimonas diminuta]MBK1977117.1 chain-length determining protein [Brevundimonas diminuta]
MSDNSNIRLIEPTNTSDSTKRKHWYFEPRVVAFGIIVALPTLVAACYYLLIASPRYVSESHFVVQRAGQGSPAALGLALSGVGLNTTSSDAFIVHEYIRSRSSLEYLKTKFNIDKVFSPPSSDPLSRAIPPWGSKTNESQYKGIQRFITVGYDSTTGISTIRVEAFDPRHAQAINLALLEGGEDVVNSMNERASASAVEEARKTVAESTERLQHAQDALTSFRNNQHFVTPEMTATEHSEIIGRLSGEIATLEAQVRQTRTEASDSPLLPTLQRRLEAYRAQLEQERAKVAGNAGSLAPKLGVYEELVFERDLASRGLTAANLAYENARIDARRQHLFLDRVVNPDRPDKAIQPKRLISILTILASCLLIYGCGYLIWAGMREHSHA